MSNDHAVKKLPTGQILASSKFLIASSVNVLPAYTYNLFTIYIHFYL